MGGLFEHTLFCTKYIVKTYPGTSVAVLRAELILLGFGRITIGYENA